MLSRKSTNQIELWSVIIFLVAHILYEGAILDIDITKRIIAYTIGLMIIAAISLFLIRNRLCSQIGYMISALVAIHVIGEEMNAVPYFLIIYMLLGTIIVIVGELKVSFCYFCIVNAFLIFDITNYYHIITSRSTFEYYMMLVMFGETILCIHMLIVVVYQRKIKEIEERNALLHESQKNKDEFLANMSHEIRTPMNIIMGTLELIMREETSEKVKEHCFNIRSAGEALVAVIDDILDFSKIESGKLTILCEPYSIATVVQDVVNTAMFRRGFKEIEIIIDCIPTMPKMFFGDVLRMRQILMNIVINAVKYTDKGHIFVSLYCYEQEGENWLHMEVRDTGIGIKEEDQKYLFDSFSRMDIIRNRSIEGTGLGLALCKRLLDAMNGTIQIKSEYGVGTTVYVDLPQKVAEEGPLLSIKNASEMKVVMFGDREEYEPMAHEYYRTANDNTWAGLGVSYHVILSFADLMKVVEQNEVTHLYTGAQEYTDQRSYFDNIAKQIKIFVMHDPQYPIKLGENIHGVNMPFYSINLASSINGETVYSQYIDKKEVQIAFKAPYVRALIVDDNDVNLRVAEGVLKLYDVNCVWAKSGKEAIELLKDQDIDIVFMDHMMPEMDGVEATKIIRRVGGEYAKNLPIVALTANAVNDAKTFFLNNGFDDFISKPISLKSVDAVLRRCIPGEKIEWVKETDETVDSCVKDDSEGSEVIENQFVSNNTMFVSMQINEETALENMGNQRDLFKELLEYCLELEEQRKQEIVESYEAQDWEEYAIRVHGLKGGMRSLGVEELALVAQEQEHAAKENRIEDVVAGHMHLMNEYERGHRSIEEYLKTFQV